MARVTTESLGRWADPADQRANRKLNRNYGRIEHGALVLLVDGPQLVDEIEYWQLWPSYWDGPSPLGWAPATSREGDMNLEPVQPPCPPPAGLMAVHLAALDPIERLACFGDSPLSLRGDVTCVGGEADREIAGPFINPHRWCDMDGYLDLYGMAITKIGPDQNETYRGAFEVRGHFDDPESSTCYAVPFGSSVEGGRSPGDPGAIVECRLLFVVTSAERLN
jgi:hypothetical protein